MLRGLFSAPVEQRDLTAANTPDDWSVAGSPTWSGMSVSGVSSLQMAAVYGCANLITNGIATLPVDVFRDTDGVSKPAPVPRWLQHPSGDLDFVAWCTQVLLSLLFSGNAYLWVRRASAMVIESLIPLDPATVTATVEHGRKVLRVNGMIPQGAEILHIPAMMWPGSAAGMSPIEHARQTIGLNLAALQYGSRFFDGDGNMPGVIEADKHMLPATKADLARQWRKMRSRAGQGLPGILDDGAKWKPTGVTSEQAQFLATQKWSAAAIAGQIFLVDPSELGIPVEGTSLTYANLAQRGTRLVRVTLLPWITRIERAITDLLPRPQYFKFNVDGLLRGDLKTQFETWQIGIDSGFLLPNEPRAWMDMEPIPGGNDVAAPAPPAPSEEGSNAA